MGKLCVSLGIAGPAKDRLVAQAGGPVEFSESMANRIYAPKYTEYNPEPPETAVETQAAVEREQAAEKEARAAGDKSKAFRHYTRALRLAWNRRTLDIARHGQDNPVAVYASLRQPSDLAILHPSSRHPGQLQLTHWETGHGPAGHQDMRTFADAVDALVSGQYRPATSSEARRIVPKPAESVTWEAVARGRLDEGVVLTLGTEAETFRAFDAMHRAMNGAPMPWSDHDPVESAELPFLCEDKGSLTKGDLTKLDAMDANKNWPDKAEGGKAFVVLWADGRGVTRFPTKAAVRAWAKRTGEWADIVWIRYQDPEYKGKKLRESGDAFSFLARADAFLHR
jgi:hypothetical protein